MGVNMIKKLISVILIITMIFTFASCDKTKKDNATIQIWYYDYGNDIAYFNSIMSIISNVKLFCDREDIPLELVKYDKKTISYEDYVLKRNIAAAGGNIIIIEDVKYMWDLSKQHADYTKLDNYENLLDVYKDKFCIPIGVLYEAQVINRGILNYYDINIDKSIITYDEYLEIKHQMKEKGARFKMNLEEYSEKTNYYINKYGLSYVNETSEIFNDKNKFKTALKNIIIETCDDFILYNDGKLDQDNIYAQNGVRTYNIYDENSQLYIYEESGANSLTNYYNFSMYSDLILNNILVVSSMNYSISPCFYMANKITNDRIYEVADFIVSEDTYKSISDGVHPYSPVFNGEKTRKILELDENLKYTGIYRINAERGQEKDVKMCKLIDEVFEMLIKNEETSKLLAEYYFINRDYVNKINSFILNSVIDLSKEGFDYKDEKINKMLDEKIDDFITNFNIHYK